MKSQTKHRILGILVIIGLMIIFMPLLQSNHKENKNKNSKIETSTFGEVIPNQAMSLADVRHVDPDDGIIDTALPEEELQVPIPTILENKKSVAVSVDKEKPKLREVATSHDTVKKVIPITIADIQKSIPAPNTKTKKLVQHKVKPTVKKPQSKIYGIKDKKKVNLNIDKLAKIRSVTWVVHVATFENKLSATHTLQDLRKKGFNAFMQEVTQLNGSEFRIFVGPESQKKSAMKLMKKINQEVKLQAVLFRYQPLA